MEKDLSLMDEIQLIKQKLAFLSPVEQQITSTRVSLLQYYANWTRDAPPMHQKDSLDGLAQGGQIIVDVQIIQAEEGEAEKARLKQRFETLYQLKFDDQPVFTQDTAAMKVANIHATILILDEFRSCQADLEGSKRLLEAYTEWHARGKTLEAYLFTTVVDGEFTRLLRLYERSIP